MTKKESKILGAAHIKNRTKGTSNELSFSVLDAAKIALDDQKQHKKNKGAFFGHIALFTMSKKKPTSTRKTPKGLHLPSDEIPELKLSASSGRSSLQKGELLPSQPCSKGTIKEKKREEGGTIKVKKPLDAGNRSGTKTRSELEQEILKRKAYRKLSKFAAYAVMAFVTACLIAAGLTYAYSEYQSHLTTVDRLKASISLMEQADETIVSLQSFLENPFSEEAQQLCDSLVEDIGEALTILSEADEEVREISVELKESVDKGVANEVVLAISYKLTILEAGLGLLVESEEIWAEAVQLREEWVAVLEADVLIRSAATLASDTTDENIEASLAKNQEAYSILVSAQAAFEGLQESYEATDYQVILEYLEKRIEAVGYAIASDEAYLERDTEQATEQNEKYNEADALASTLAKLIPSDPSSLVYEVYEESTEEIGSIYDSACSNAESSDAFIRDYLGTG